LGVGSDPQTQWSAPEVLMPAIASLEDLKAAQKEGVSIYTMLYTLCFTEMASNWLEEYM
jgi:hypothetical protein